MPNGVAQSVCLPNWLAEPNSSPLPCRETGAELKVTASDQELLLTAPPPTRHMLWPLVSSSEIGEDWPQDRRGCFLPQHSLGPSPLTEHPFRKYDPGQVTATQG